MSCVDTPLIEKLKRGDQVREIVCKEKLLVSREVVAALIVERVPIDDLLAKEIVKLQELVYRSPIFQVLLHTFVERDLVLVCCLYR